MVLLDLRSRLVLLFARRVWRLDLFPMSCQNHHLPRKDQMFYLIGRLLSAALTRLSVLAAAAGFIAALPAAPSCRTQKPTRARAGNPPLPSKNLLFPRLENTSFLPQCGRPDSWPNLQ